MILVIAASTFWENFSFWNQVERGQERIPWSSIVGTGDDGGDMDRPVLQHGWPNDRIIGPYNGVGDVCLLILIGVYIAFLVAERSRVVPYIKHRLGLDRG